MEVQVLLATPIDFYGYNPFSYKKMEKIHLSDHFTYKKILRFTISPILMMFITSIYWIVDGFFLTNYASPSAFAGVNLIFPIIMIVACVGFMYGAGGAALVSKYLGEKRYAGQRRSQKRARGE